MQTIRIRKEALHILLMVFFIIKSQNVISQQLHHQMISSQGASVELSNGLKVKQTIGQQSIIGNQILEDGSVISQGYQQAFWYSLLLESSPILQETITYPNPFIDEVNFQFSFEINESISIQVFDLNGRLVYQANKQAKDYKLTIELGRFSDGEYLVKLLTPNYKYYTKILKVE